MAGEVVQNTYERRPRSAVRGIMALLAIGAAAGALAKSTHISRYERLESTYLLAGFDPQTRSYFDYLAKMKPDEFDTSTAKYHQELGQYIQDSAAHIFLEDIRLGLDNKGVAVDMADMVHEIIPPKTMAALEADGYVFTEESPVSCNAEAPNGDHGYDPLDYSNHAPSDFKVTTSSNNAHLETIIPLGSQETTSPDQPWFMPEYPPLFPAGVFPHFDVNIPCVDAYPHKLYQPNGTTYPADRLLQIELY